MNNIIYILVLFIIVYKFISNHSWFESKLMANWFFASFCTVSMLSYTVVILLICTMALLVCFLVIPNSKNGIKN